MFTEIIIHIVLIQNVSVINIEFLILMSLNGTTKIDEQYEHDITIFKTKHLYGSFPNKKNCGTTYRWVVQQATCGNRTKIRK